MKDKEKGKEKEKTMTLSEYWEKETNIESNEFVDKSLCAMWERYDLDAELFKEGVEALKVKIDKIETYDGLMRFLAGIFRNITQRNMKFKKLD